MIDISLSVFRLFGDVKFSAELSEGGYSYLTVQDTADVCPSVGQVRFQLHNYDLERLRRAVAAWNEVMCEDE